MHPNLRTKLLLLFLLLVMGGPAIGSGQVAAFATRSQIQVSNTSLKRIITEYPLPGNESGPVNITAGPDGNLWFTQVYTNQIGKITRRGSLTEYTISHHADSWPEDITAGPDGNLWFTQIYGNQIGKVTPRGTFTEYPLPTAGSQPFGITVGPDGNLWFTENSGDRIGRIRPIH